MLDPVRRAPAIWAPLVPPKFTTATYFMLFYGISFLAFVVVIVAAYVRGVKDKYPDVCIAVALPLFMALLAPIGVITAWLRPVTLDAAFRQADLALGLDGFAFTRWLTDTGLYEWALPVYVALPLMLALGWSLERSFVLVRAVVIGAFLCLPFYLLLPACGPEYAYIGFPGATGASISEIPWRPRNCFPSMHFTWALLLVLNVRHPRWRWLFIAYAILMPFAAVAGGEHYFVDMIAAVPFTVAVQKLARLVTSYQSARIRMVPAPSTLTIGASQNETEPD